MASTARQIGKVARRSKRTDLDTLVHIVFKTSELSRIQAAIEDARVPGTALRALGRSIELPRAEFAPVLAMQERTIARREVMKKPLSGTESERLYRLARIVDLADAMIGERKKARAWLVGPVPSLAGRRPIDLLKSDIGIAQVERALFAIGYGGVA